MSKDSQNEKWYLIGITSYGKKCGKLTGVYTRVSAYYDWIRKNIKS
jgi:secreted trypsin-like serine protease